MKAVVFERYGGPEQLALREWPKPQPEEGEVRIRVRAVSINDWDHGALHGKPWINRLFFGWRKPWRRILGSDVSGVVEAVTGDCRLRPGDEVFGDLSGRWGGLAEYVCAPEALLTRKPASMTHIQAAALPQAGLLALQGLECGGALRTGARVLINGAGGGVGTFALQLARLHGAHLIAVDRAEKADLLRTLGADQVLDYQVTDFAQGAECYDVILDARSTRSPFACLRALAKGGRYVTVGGDLHRLLALFAAGPVLRGGGRRLRILALRANHGLQRLVELFEQARLAPVIDGRYRLDQTPDAFRRFATGRHLGKVVVEID